MLNPTYQPSQAQASSWGSTPTVPKETSSPPAKLLCQRPKHPVMQGPSINQHGPNDDKPHFVCTSKIATQCLREEETGNGGNSLQERNCILNCIETSKLYLGNILIREIYNLFESDCPEDDLLFLDIPPRLGDRHNL
mmetsp:Transcript_8123/g.17559  ORF Transcript_8123/g.17559 Transcript_8123/m.17559 type:complete len:137 (+) Transcript_8123:343-753(+)